MKNLKYLAAAAAVVFLASCGGKKENSDEAIVLKPETTHVKGSLSDNFEVVDKEYTVIDGVLSVEVKRTDVDFAFNVKGVEHYGTYGEGVTGNVGFGIELLDENDNVIDTRSATEGGMGGMYSHDDMTAALKLKAGETCIVRWSVSGDKKPVKFRLTSAYDEVETSSETLDDSDDFDDSDDSDDSDISTSSASVSDVEGTARDMVNKSRKRAEEMVDKSRKQAEDMVKQSHKQAEDMMKQSRKQAEDMMKNLPL